jgi:hypothetical protein
MHSPPHYYDLTNFHGLAHNNDNNDNNDGIGNDDNDNETKQPNDKHRGSCVIDRVVILRASTTIPTWRRVFYFSKGGIERESVCVCVIEG